MNLEKRQTALSTICQAVLGTWPQNKWIHTRIVVAVSGGPDSVAMLRVLHSLMQEYGSIDQLVVAHINHMTRKHDSHQDQRFVEGLAKQLNLSFEIKRADQNGHENLSEESLRHFRYEFLAQIAQTTGARYIATGHNLDDQIETILFRIFRGTGLSGLAGIPTFRDLGNGVTVVRPFLSIPRRKILTLLKELEQDYRVDSSNSASDYTRNFMRNEIVPKIENRFGDSWGKGLLRLAAQASENRELLDQLSDPIYSVIDASADLISIERSTIANQPPVLIRHALVRTWQKLNWPLQNMTSIHWTALCDFILRESTVNPITLPGNIRVEQHRDKITIMR